MTTRTRRRVGAGLLICAVLAALTLAGCSKSAGSNTSAPAGPAPEFNGQGAADGVAANPAPAPVNADAQKAPGAAGAGTAPQQQQIEPVERSIIYSANMSVIVKDVNKAADDAANAARDAGGSVSADQRSLSGDRSTAQLTLRVPSTAFSSTLERVA